MEWVKGKPSNYYAWRLQEKSKTKVGLRCLAGLHWVMTIYDPILRGLRTIDLGQMSEDEAKATALALYRMQ